MVHTLTDNRNRTAGDLRHYFDKCGGNLGQTGSVSFLFEQKGVLVIDADGLNEDKLLEDALIDGVLDVDSDAEVAEITTEPPAFGRVREALEALGYTFLYAQVAYVPTTTTVLRDPEIAQKMQKLLDMLDDNDDVQEVWHNWEPPEEAQN